MNNDLDTQQGTIWGKHFANVQLDVSIASHTKVSSSWNEVNYTPDFNKLYFILEGEGYVKVNDRTYYPKPGELYLLPSNSIQSYGTISDNTFDKYWCHFTARIGNINLFQLIETSAYINVMDEALFKKQFEKLIYYLQNPNLSSGFRVHSILLDFIAEFIEQSRHVKLKMATSPTFYKMNAILIYIEENLDENYSVEHLAKMANFHPNYFISVFKNFTGYTPIQYINRHRIEKAKHLLVMSDLNVSSISNSLGMELAYFSRMFREQTGFSPTSYRMVAAKPQLPTV